MPEDYEDSAQALERINAIQHKVHQYADELGKIDLVDSWSSRREIVKAQRIQRVMAREDLKEDLIWLALATESLTRLGAGSSSIPIRRAQAAIRMIVDVI